MAFWTCTIGAVVGITWTWLYQIDKHQALAYRSVPTTTPSAEDLSGDTPERVGRDVLKCLEARQRELAALGLKDQGDAYLETFYSNAAAKVRENNALAVPNRAWQRETLQEELCKCENGTGFSGLVKPRPHVYGLTCDDTPAKRASK